MLHLLISNLQLCTPLQMLNFVFSLTTSDDSNFIGSYFYIQQPNVKIKFSNFVSRTFSYRSSSPNFQIIFNLLSNILSNIPIYGTNNLDGIDGCVRFLFKNRIKVEYF